MGDKLLAAMCVVPLLGGCGDLGTGDGTDGGAGGGIDAGDPIPTLVVRGTYDGTEDWDLSSAISHEDGAGGIVGDILVDQTVGLIGVPSSLEDEAHDVVHDAIYDSIRDYVNGITPVDLHPDSQFIADLREIFGNMEVDTVLDITSDSGGDLLGSKEATAIRLVRADQVLDVDFDELLMGTGLTKISALVNGSFSGSSATLDPHELDIRLDTLVDMAANELLGTDVETLLNQAVAAVDCDAVVGAFVSGDSYGVSVGGMSFSVSTETLIEACESMVLDLAAQVYGLFGIGTGVVVGGGIGLGDGNGDTIVDTVTSRSSYMGTITSSPLPIPPEFDVSFSAARR